MEINHGHQFDGLGNGLGTELFYYCGFKNCLVLEH